jgi:hypothetical protein
LGGLPRIPFRPMFDRRPAQPPITASMALD